jgi:hypothetical protein
MAFGGLLDVLTPVVLVDNGWDGGTLQMTHRAWVVTASVMAESALRPPFTDVDPAVCVVKGYLGKVANTEFVAYADLTPVAATFTRSEFKALGTITLAAIIAAAKTKLGLT